MKAHSIKDVLLAAAAGAVLAAPAGAVSLPSTATAQPIPENGRYPAAPLAIDSWSAGSASLVPLMAADLPSRHAAFDAPAEGAADASQKPLDDMSFVKQATLNGRKEVAAAREALPQLKSPALKRIAEMLVTDHSGANERLSKIAEAKGWPVPAPQAAAPPASGTASSDFDARWSAEMIAGHEKSIALYRAQAQSGDDKDLRKFARDTLPTIEHHLAELRSAQK